MPRIMIDDVLIGNAIRATWQLKLSEEIDLEYGVEQIILMPLSYHLLTKDHNQASLRACKEISSILKEDSRFSKDEVMMDVLTIMRFEQYYVLYEELAHLTRNIEFSDIHLELFRGRLLARLS